MTKYYIILTLIGLITITLFCLLMYFDSKRNYDINKICGRLINENGCLFIHYSYYIWQIKKINLLQNAFSDTIIFNNITYSIVAVFSDQSYSPCEAVLIPFIHREYVLQVELYHKHNTTNSIVNTTTINGNNNTVNVNQNIENNMYDYIEQFLSQDINSIDKRQVELFKYKFKAGEASVSDAKRTIEVLTKYAPYITFVTALINIIKAIFL